MATLFLWVLWLPLCSSSLRFRSFLLSYYIPHACQSPLNSVVLFISGLGVCVCIVLHVGGSARPWESFTMVVVGGRGAPYMVFLHCHCYTFNVAEMFLTRPGDIVGDTTSLRHHCCCQTPMSLPAERLSKANRLTRCMLIV